MSHSNLSPLSHRREIILFSMLGLLLAFSYILFMQFSTQFAIQSSLDPQIAVWIPNMMFAGIGIVMLFFAPK